MYKPCCPYRRYQLSLSTVNHKTEPDVSSSPKSEINSKHNIFYGLGKSIYNIKIRLPERPEYNKQISLPLFKTSITKRNMKLSYDPKFINTCKRAIVKIKEDLPNYKEIIKNINTEFGINTQKDSYLSNYYKYCNLFNKKKTRNFNVNNFSCNLNNSTSLNTYTEGTQK